MSKLTDAITRVNQQAKTMSKAKVAAMHKSLKTSHADLIDYQRLQAAAFAMGKISYEDAQVLYRIYGREGVSPEHWEGLSLGEKVIGTKAASELIDMRLGGRKSPKNPFGEPGITECPMCGMEVYVKTHESRSEALRRHLHRIHAGQKKGMPQTGPFLDQWGYAVKENPKRRVVCKTCGYTGHLTDFRVSDLGGEGKSKTAVSYVMCPKCHGVKLSATNPITNELYRSFHGYNPARRRKVTLPKPEGGLVKLGRLVRLDYSPEGQTQHRSVTFFHKAGDTGDRKLRSNTILATDSKGKNLFLIKDDPKSRYPFVNDRGIIG